MMRETSRALWSRAAAVGLALSVAVACGGNEPAAPSETPAESAPSAGGAAPDTPELFAEGVISTDAPEFATAFTPDGSAVYFNRTTPDGRGLSIYRAVRYGDGWAEPLPAPFAGDSRDPDPFVSFDGRRIYFSSNRALPDETGDAASDFDLWYVERDGDTWGAPVNLTSLNSPAQEVFASLTRDGAIYFASNRGKSVDIYTAGPGVNGGFGDPQLLPAPVNSDEDDENNPLIAPDGSFLIFSSARDGGQGDMDLYVSFNQDGTWTAPKNLGPTVNSEASESAPALSPDGTVLYFTSSRRGAGGDIYRIALTAALQGLRP
ncbi:MAG: TolB family protein [Vicinamibacterales bacterium]